MGPCMCGDTRCFSCGPAQGNSRCEVCGKWTDEGGCDNPEACDTATNEMYEAEEKERALPLKQRIMNP